jgi:hypothetical protein
MRPVFFLLTAIIWAFPGFSKNVNNIAQLQTTDTVGGVRTVLLLGYYKPGDGGGGSFYWDDTATSKIRGISVADTINPAPTGRWKRLLNTDYIDARWMGAVANDSTIDNAGFFTQASSFAGSLRKILHIVNGIFWVKTTTSITSNVFAKSSIIRIPSNITLSPVFSISSQVYRRIEGVHIENTTRSSLRQDGIFIGNASNRLHIVNTILINLNGYGMHLDRLWDSNIDQVNMNDCGSTEYQQPAFYVGSDAGDNTNQCTFTGIQTENSRYYGIYVDDSKAYSNRFIGMHCEWNILHRVLIK